MTSKTDQQALQEAKEIIADEQPNIVQQKKELASEGKDPQVSEDKKENKESTQNGKDNKRDKDQIEQVEDKENEKNIDNAKENGTNDKVSEEPQTKKAKTGLSVGDEIIDFELETDQSSQEKPDKVSIKDIVKEHGAILFFYPKANTPGCTTQATGFRDDYEKYISKGYQILGVSADPPSDQASWKSENKFQYTLLSDPDHEVLSQLGVSQGKQINRSHIIIEKGGKIKDIRISISPSDSLKLAKELILEEN